MAQANASGHALSFGKPLVNWLVFLIVPAVQESRRFVGLIATIMVVYSAWQHIAEAAVAVSAGPAGQALGLIRGVEGNVYTRHFALRT